VCRIAGYAEHILMPAILRSAAELIEEKLAQSNDARGVII
jgi:hypothetical protein